MFQDILAMGSGGDSGSLAVDTITFTGNVSSSKTYTFGKDFKYVIIIDATNGYAPTWYQNNIKINDTVVTDDIDGGIINGAMGSSSYTLWATISNIKSGDVLKTVSGSFNFLMIGMN